MRDLLVLRLDQRVLELGWVLVSHLDLQLERELAMELGLE
jgi:hypothetical protein